MVLDSCVEVARGCNEVCRLLYSNDEKAGQTTLQNIERYSRRIHRYQKQAASLLDRCVSTEELVSRSFKPSLAGADSDISYQISKILAFRDNELAQSNHQAMRESLEVLKGLSLQGREENVKLTELATQSHKDSRMLKALTVIATTYLPGTFIAVSEITANNLQSVTGLMIHRLYSARI